MAPSVRDVPARSRYELVVDEQIIGIADYRIDDDQVIFPHTEIVPHLRARGYGELLVRGALDDVRTRGSRWSPGAGSSTGSSTTTPSTPTCAPPDPASRPLP